MVIKRQTWIKWSFAGTRSSAECEFNWKKEEKNLSYYSFMMLSGFSYGIDVFFFPIRSLKCSSVRLKKWGHSCIGLLALKAICSRWVVRHSSFTFTGWEDVNDVDLMNYVRVLHQYNKKLTPLLSSVLPLLLLLLFREVIHCCFTKVARCTMIIASLQ